VRTAPEDRDWAGAAPGEDDFEEVVRRALSAAADCVEPAGDGLTLIFRRLGAPWLVRQMSLLATGCVDLLQLTTIWLQPMFARAMSVIATVGGSRHRTLRRLTSQEAIDAPTFPGQHRSKQGPAAIFWGRLKALKARPRLRTAAAWLRPALAVAATVAVVATGTIALSQAVARISLTGMRGAGAPALAGAAPGASDPWSTPSGPGLAQIPPTWPGTTPASGGDARHRHSCAATRCLSGPAGAPASGPAATPPAQPAAYPSPSYPSPSPAPTPTPLPSHHRPHPHHPHPHPHQQTRKPHPPHPGPAETPGY
jgi:hypothetical protein